MRKQIVTPLCLGLALFLVSCADSSNTGSTATDSTNMQMANDSMEMNKPQEETGVMVGGANMVPSKTSWKMQPSQRIILPWWQRSRQPDWLKPSVGPDHLRFLHPLTRLSPNSLLVPLITC